MPENNEPTEAELIALQEHRRELAQHVTDSIEVLARLASDFDQRGDARSAARIRERITSLERKREEVLSGKR